jgi:hypothetical protein
MPRTTSILSDAILDHRVVCRKRGFLVHWEGYSDIEDSWVKEADIDPEMVKAFLEGLDREKETLCRHQS